MDMIWAAIITAIGSLLGIIITKYDLYLWFLKAPHDISGHWNGMSIYMPFKPGPIVGECICKFTAEIKQVGRRVTIVEKITEIYDINMEKLEIHPARLIHGSGRMLNGKDVLIHFNEIKSLTCGSMYLVVNTWADEIEGILAVRNPYLGTPVAVKIKLKKDGISKPPVSTKDLGIDDFKAISEAIKPIP